MKERAKAMPKWLPAFAAISITVMVCLTVNFRAFSELREEADQNKTLNAEIEKKTSENLALQEEIHYLKNDSKTIEREAQKLGLLRKKEKVSVPAAK
ncbi:MAG TPA: septum formation initiator family protein [Pyrinomonadaceae bacterium]|nr:septum formation initiator family protein [Pyrinomonadaceae bacterium]